MTDNTLVNGEPIATDEIQDGGVADGAKVERVKVGFGPDGYYIDVDDQNAMPVYLGNGYPNGTSVNPLYVSTSDPIPVSAVQPDVDRSLVSDVEGVATFAVPDASAVNISIYGANGFPWTGTVVFEAANTEDANGPGWLPLSVVDLSTGLTVTETSADGQFYAPARSPIVRVRATALTSGEVLVELVRRLSGPASQAPASGGTGGTVTVDNFPAAQPVTDNGGSITVDGSVNVGNFPATQPVSIAGPVPVTVGNFPATQPVSIATAVPINDNGGSITVDGAVAVTAASAATLTNVSGSATSVTLVAANASRRGAVIVNDSTATLYVKFGTTASTTSYTYLLVAGATLEFAAPVYTGAVTGIWSAANGSARVTELT